MRIIELSLTAREGTLFINPESIEVFHQTMVYDEADYRPGSMVRLASGVQYNVVETPDRIRQMIDEADD